MSLKKVIFNLGVSKGHTHTNIYKYILSACSKMVKQVRWKKNRNSKDNKQAKQHKGLASLSAKWRAPFRQSEERLRVFSSPSSNTAERKSSLACVASLTFSLSVYFDLSISPFLTLSPSICIPLSLSPSISLSLTHIYTHSQKHTQAGTLSLSAAKHSLSQTHKRARKAAWKTAL